MHIVAYYRVSTEKQARSGLGLEAQEQSEEAIEGVRKAKQTRSGLGLEAQEQAIEGFRRAHDGQIIKSFTEIESGKKNDRPEVAKALAHARRTGATVVIAKLDRLTRNARFLLGIVESGANVAFCELPQVPPGPLGKFFLTLMAAVAELEAGLISQRTKAALSVYKSRGGKLGASRENGRRLTPELRAQGRAKSAAIRHEKAIAHMSDLAVEIRELRDTGHVTLAQIAEYLHSEGHTTPRGKRWTAKQVQRVLERLEK
jgi:DNA invertase Pin-like site-specific DNA recombinase